MNATFLNFAAQSPTVELHLSIAEKLHSENNEPNVFFICDSALKSCSINVTNNKAICLACKNRAENSVKLFRKKYNAEIIYVTRKALDELNSGINSIDINIVDNLELGVRSSVASHVRIDQIEKLNGMWKEIYLNMFDSSKSLYLYFKEKIQLLGIKNLIAFNGRFSCARPIVEASENSGINYFLFDTIMQKRPYFVKNYLLHNLEVSKKNAIKTYLDFFAGANELAETYMHSKVNKIAVNDKVYTRKQQKSFVPKEVIDSSRPIISIFSSSDDEYRYLGADWKSFPIVSQVDSIKTLLKSGLSDYYTFVLRMHPNQEYMSKANTTDYMNLKKEGKIIILEPSNNTDSYELIKISTIVINFCSTIGIEANYLRKPVIQIGPSSFRLLPAANYTRDALEAIDLITSKNFKIMPIRASIIWFAYLTKFQDSLPSFKHSPDGSWTYNGESVPSSKILRILSLPAKIYVNLCKSNYSFLRKAPMYLYNLILNKYKQ